MKKPLKKGLLIRVGVALLVLGLIAWAWAAGLYEDIDLESIRTALRDSGPWGPILFVTSMSILQPLHVSVYLFLLPAAAVWSGPVAFGLGWLGCMGAALTSFLFSRYMARDWVQSRMPERLKKYEERLEHEGVRTVILLRLLLFTTPSIQLMYGATRVKFRDYMIGTAVGNTPYVAVIILLGDRINAWLQVNPPSSWFG